MRHAASFLWQATVSQNELTERMEVVHLFLETSDQYEAIVKDRFTGEHYFHRGDRHLNVPAGGAEEVYHSLLPLETDEVISLVNGQSQLVFPQGWMKTYLRNGPDGLFVWFNPEMTIEHDSDEQFGADLHQKLLELKRSGQYDADSIARFYSEIDKLKNQLPSDRE